DTLRNHKNNTPTITLTCIHLPLHYFMGLIFSFALYGLYDDFSILKCSHLHYRHIPRDNITVRLLLSVSKWSRAFFFTPR
ncbi:hypothetical protein L9F63_007271, partial [Diploptera punctata]